MQRNWKWILVLFAVTIPLATYADINQDLIKAAWKGQIDRMRALLEDGADVNAEGSFGLTALMRADYNRSSIGDFRDFWKTFQPEQSPFSSQTLREARSCGNAIPRA